MAASKSRPNTEPEEDGVAAPASNPGPDELPLTTRLGEREREVMAVLWAQGGANVQQVATRLSTALAYTTVMTTLDRLFKKGLLRREKKDRAFIYSAKLSAEEVEKQRAAHFIQRFFSDSGEQQDILLSCLVNAVHQYDATLLDQLEAKVRSARSQQNVPKPGTVGGN